VTALENSTSAPQMETRLGSTLFTITGICRDCPVTMAGSFNLFDDSFRRRRSLLPNKPIVIRRQLTNDSSIDSNACVCPVGAQPSIENGVSSLDFEAAFIDELKELSEESKTESIAVTATSVTEGQEVECGPDVATFDAATYVDLGVDPATLTRDEISVLKASFVSAYNSLSFASCDGFFRIAAQVEIVTEFSEKQQSRWLQALRDALINATEPFGNVSSAVNSNIAHNDTAAGESSAIQSTALQASQTSALFKVNGVSKPL